MTAGKEDIVWSLPEFYFQITIDNHSYNFSEISGLSTEIKTDDSHKEDVNSHILPKKYSNIIMKKALQPINQSDMKWVQQILNGNFELKFFPKNVLIKLLNNNGTAIYSWSCENAYPVKWQVENLDSETNSILIESIEFAYAQLKRL